MLLALIGLHGVLAVAAPLAARRLGRGVFWLAAVAPAAALLAVAARAPAVLAGGQYVESWAWAPSIGLDVSLRLDAFALLMVLLVAGVGVLILAYSTRYFSSAEPRVGRLAGLLVGFAGAMLGLVLADNLLILYAFWELTSITSYLLIGFDEQKGSVRAAALQALLVTVAGGLAMLGGIVVLGQAGGTYTLSALLADPPTGPAATGGVLLVLLGAVTKSAQVPFHFWLPAAMAAPTPVSAYLHSATMVKAGVYLVARLAPAFAVLGMWRPVVVGIGVATMLLGGWRALRQHDLKLLLAYGTVSQLGFMVALLGAGVPQATFAGGVLLLAHGAFKATLFLVVGIIDHQTHTRDVRRLSGLAQRMPLLTVVAAVAAASMAGLPPLFGFIAKEAAFAAFLDGPLGALGPPALAGLVAGSVLTFAYSARFLVEGFGTKAHARELVGPDAPRPAFAFVAPAALLALLTVVFGLFPEPLSPLVGAAAVALDAHVEPESLHLWHGLEPALGLSALAVALGTGLFLVRRPFESLQKRLWPWPGADRAYASGLVGLNRTADLLTATVQTGSLPRYLVVILATAVILPASALIRLGPVPLPASAWDSPLQLAVVVALMAAAGGMVLVRRRFAAVLLLGSIGFSVAVLFVLHGAPDLALTQLLVETVSIVAFVLVLRHLPAEFERAPHRLGRALRVVVAGSTGLFVFIFALFAGAARTRPPVSGEYLERALHEAGGRNVVNVILVDFRGIDTFGEITVLLVAALGVVGLLRARRQPEREAAEEREAA